MTSGCGYAWLCYHHSMGFRHQMRQAVNRWLKTRRLYLERRPGDFTDPEMLPPEFFSRRIPCEEIAFRDEAQVRWLEEDVLPRQEQFSTWAIHEDDATPAGYFLANRYFGPVDAETYFCVIQERRPARIIEVGSGHSTRVARHAIKEGGTRSHLTCIDPDPRVSVAGLADEHWRQTVQSVPVSRFEALKAHDILFIDSSHRLEIGGDLPFLYLEVLPRLAEGVLVHIHDIYLPRHYPQYWVQVECRGYNEQYAVALMLARNRMWEVLWASQWMLEHHRERVEEVFPNIQRVKNAFPDNRDIPASPGSLWLKKTCS